MELTHYEEIVSVRPYVSCPDRYNEIRLNLIINVYVEIRSSLFNFTTKECYPKENTMYLMQNVEK